MGLYSIFKKLFLNDVEEIELDEEKILVRGEDGVVKAVDKSSFGGGGSASLQLTLDGGKTWTNVTDGLKYLTVSDPVNGNVFSWLTGTASFTVSPNAVEGSSVFNFQGGVNNGEGNEDNKGVVLIADTPESNTTFRFRLPVDLEPNGDHMSDEFLATRSQLNLSRILTGGDTAFDKNIILKVSNPDPDFEQSLSIFPTGFFTYNTADGGVVYTGVNAQYDRVVVSEGISATESRQVDFFSNKISVTKNIDEASTFLNLLFPNRGNSDVNYQETLATLSDVSVTLSNNTTTALSSSDLNTAYPEAKTGDKIHCTDILTGAVIYEKTESGWFQYSITAVGVTEDGIQEGV